MKKSDMQKYFKQKAITVLDVVLAAGALGGWAFSTFVWGGGRIGIPVFVVFAAVLGAKRSMRIKDSEFDSALSKMYAQNDIDPESDDTITAFDYRNEVVKGRDQKLRGRYCWATKYAFHGNYAEITAWKLDVQNNETKSFTYTISKADKVEVIEENIRIAGRFKQIVHLTHPAFENPIPVTTEDVNSDKLITRLKNGNY